MHKPSPYSKNHNTAKFNWTKIPLKRHWLNCVRPTPWCFHALGPLINLTPDVLQILLFLSHTLSLLPSRFSYACPQTLDDHLRNTLAAQRLAPHKSLAFDCSQKIEESSNQKQNRRCDQARWTSEDGYAADPLDQGHHTIYARAHVIRGESTHECVELGGGWADAKEKRNLDEDNDERACAAECQNIESSIFFSPPKGTYTQRAPKRIVSETWNRFEIPTAKQRNMQITPVLTTPGLAYALE